MSNRSWVVSDTHFGHEKCCTTFTKADGVTPLRPFANADEMDEEMIRRWNEVVKPGDTVYHVGDVVINKKHLHKIGRCNGTKILIAGNHDTATTEEFLVYFKKVVAMKMFKDMILTHLPIHEGQIPRMGTNVHGHMHANTIPDPRYFCVCVEHTDFAPISIDDLRIRIKEKQDEYNFTPGKPWGNAAHKQTQNV